MNIYKQTKRQIIVKKCKGRSGTVVTVKRLLDDDMKILVGSNPMK